MYRYQDFDVHRESQIKRERKKGKKATVLSTLRGLNQFLSHINLLNCHPESNLSQECHSWACMGAPRMPDLALVWISCFVFRLYLTKMINLVRPRAYQEPGTRLCLWSPSRHVCCGAARLSAGPGRSQTKSLVLVSSLYSRVSQGRSSVVSAWIYFRTRGNRWYLRRKPRSKDFFFLLFFLSTASSILVSMKPFDGR